MVDAQLVKAVLGLPGHRTPKMRFTRAIVCPPTPNFYEGITTAKDGPPDYQTALLQHQAYSRTLKKCGLTVTLLDADPRYPDATFIEDTAVIAGNHAIITRPGAASRLGEVANVRERLGDFFSSLDSIQQPGTLDGGDVCQAGNHFFIGISLRTNEEGAEQLARLLERYGYTSSFVNIRGANNLLHLKSGLAHLDENRLVVIEELATNPAFAGYELIRMTKGEEYAANCIRINQCVLVAAGFPEFERMLSAMGYQPLVLNVSEFEKMDGGLSCLSLRL